MNIKQLLLKADALLGETVVVEAFILVRLDGGYLLDSLDEREDLHAAIKVDVSDLSEIMLAHVPPRGGGKCFYADPAIVKGRLEQDETGVFAYRLCEVTELRVHISDEWFTAIGE